MHPLVLPLAAAALAATACCWSDNHRSATTFAEQAAWGETLFARHCAECHGDSGEGDEAPRVVGLDMGALPTNPPATRRVRTMRFVTVGDVADFVVANMPAKRPTSVTNDEKLAILAFDLQANGIDAGPEPLTMARARTLVIPR